MRRALPELPARLHALVQPVMTRLIESTRAGQAGVSTERFEQALDAEIAALASAPAPSARFSAARLLVWAVSAAMVGGPIVYLCWPR